MMLMIRQQSHMQPRLRPWHSYPCDMCCSAVSRCGSQQAREAHGLTDTHTTSPKQMDKAQQKLLTDTHTDTKQATPAKQMQKAPLEGSMPLHIATAHLPYQKYLSTFVNASDLVCSMPGCLLERKRERERERERERPLVSMVHWLRWVCGMSSGLG